MERHPFCGSAGLRYVLPFALYCKPGDLDSDGTHKGCPYEENSKNPSRWKIGPYSPSLWSPTCYTYLAEYCRTGNMTHWRWGLGLGVGYWMLGTGCWSGSELLARYIGSAFPRRRGN
jgi:hypothetical protein